MAEIVVEVVLAWPGHALRKQLSLAEGATVGQAVAAAGLGEHEALVDLERLGVFGRRVAAGDLLRDGDRVEIYRPLAIDPKEARRRRAR